MIDDWLTEHWRCVAVQSDRWDKLMRTASEVISRSRRQAQFQSEESGRCQYQRVIQVSRHWDERSGINNGSHFYHESGECLMSPLWGTELEKHGVKDLPCHTYHPFPRTSHMGSVERVEYSGTSLFDDVSLHRSTAGVRGNVKLFSGTDEVHSPVWANGFHRSPYSKETPESIDKTWGVKRLNDLYVNGPSHSCREILQPIAYYEQGLLLFSVRKLSIGQKIHKLANGGSVESWSARRLDIFCVWNDPRSLRHVTHWWMTWLTHHLSPTIHKPAGIEVVLLSSLLLKLSWKLQYVSMIGRTIFSPL